jgi:AcrR family transcriptional regulator
MPNLPTSSTEAGADPAKRASPGRPKASAAERDANRQMLLGAAERVYARMNYADITVDHLIAEAGISRPTFYRWFSSKDEVLEEIVARANDVLIAAIPRAVADEHSVAGKIRAGVDAYLRWGIETGRRVPALYREASQHGSPVFRDRKRVGKAMLMLYQHQGELHDRPQIHPLVYQTLIAATEYANSWLIAREQPGLDDIAVARQVMLRIVLSTLADDIGAGELPSVPTFGHAAAGMG